MRRARRLLCLCLLCAPLLRGDDLVVSEVLLVKTPQAGSMRACILVECRGREARYHVPREYPRSDLVALPVRLRIRDVGPGDPVRIRIRLDDDEPRVCSPAAEDQTVVEFRAGRSGRKIFRPTSRWVVEVRSHLKRIP